MFVFYLQPIDLTGGRQLVTAMMGMIFLYIAGRISGKGNSGVSKVIVLVSL